ncbi:MAG: hypothetical protein ACK4GK_03265 [Ferrovibrio sp.]
MATFGSRETLDDLKRGAHQVGGLYALLADDLPSLIERLATPPKFYQLADTHVVDEVPTELRADHQADAGLPKIDIAAIAALAENPQPEIVLYIGIPEKKNYTENEFIRDAAIPLAWLKNDVLRLLQSGKLKARGLQREDQNPRLTPRGHWYSLDVDICGNYAWDTGRGIRIHELDISPDQTLHGQADDADENDAEDKKEKVKTKPYLDEFYRRVKRGEFEMQAAVDYEEQLIEWGRSQGLPVPRPGSIIRAINRKPRIPPR